MLIEVHIIQNHAPSNLNRDDSGSPKTAMFGGYRRARISSQCLKHCYRTSSTFRDEVDGIGMHTRAMPDEVIRRAGIQLSQEEAIILKQLLANAVNNGEEPASQDDKLKTAQSVFWRECELDALTEAVREWAAGDRNTNFDPKAALRPEGLNWAGIPVDMALFGRMVTSDLMHNVEASSQFAHAISTNEFVREFDLWTRVDDRRDKRLDWYRSAFEADEKLEPGTDGMGDAEFTSSCFYSYFNVDFDGLNDNLTGRALNHRLMVSDDDAQRARERACCAVAGLVKAAIKERPTGKFNSMATASLPALVLVEVHDSHMSVSYADAFAKPVDPKNEETQSDTGQVQRVDLPEESARRLIREANRITTAFCRSARSRLIFTGGRELGVSLDQLAAAPVQTVDDINDLVEKLKVILMS